MFFFPDPNLHYGDDGSVKRISEILGLQAYLEVGLEQITEKLRLEHFDFSKDNVKDGEFDDKLAQIINLIRDENVSQYLRSHRPSMLNGRNYKVIALVSSGENHLTLLATDRNSNEDVVIKMPVTPMTDKNIVELLKEYMFQQQAHALLKENCKTPQPLGFIRVRKKGIYMMVSKFCPFLPGYYSVLTLKDALSSHATRPRLRKCEWRNVCLSLITAVLTLQRGNIYHNNICHKNVLLQVSDNSIVPVIVDFSKASRGVTGKTTPLFEPVPNRESGEQHPSVAPELYQQPNPLATSDLYSVLYLIMKVSVYLQFPNIENYITDYRLKDPRDRDGHKIVYDKILDFFLKDTDARIDLTVDDMAPPAQGE